MSTQATKARFYSKLATFCGNLGMIKLYKYFAMKSLRAGLKAPEHSLEVYIRNKPAPKKDN